jgi:hypothetical protein
MFSSIKKFRTATARRLAGMSVKLPYSNDNLKVAGDVVRPRQSRRPSLACYWRPAAGGGLACHWDVELLGDTAAGEPDQRGIVVLWRLSFAQAA